jgi:phosphatidylglycerophosphate synthase
MTTHTAGTRIDQAYRRVTVPIARRLAGRSAVTPNRVSAVAFLFGGLISPVLAVRGRLTLAGLAFLAGDVLDYLDGDVARAQGTASQTGDILDGVLDRYTDILSAGALTVVSLRAARGGSRHRRLIALTGWAASVGVLLPSYLQAVAFANGRQTVQSIGGRGTRNRVTWLALLCRRPLYGILTNAVLSHVAAAHRAVHVLSQRES